MNNKTIIASAGVLFVVGILIIYCIMREENTLLKAENEDLEDKNRKLETDRILLIKDSLQRNNDVSDIIKEQLIDLGNQFEKLSPPITRQIRRSLEMIHLGHKEAAIADLAKVMENLLKHRYEHHTGFIKWVDKKQKSFHNYLEYCFREEKKIDEVEYKFYAAVKTIRNKDAHDLNTTFDDNLSNVGILSAINGITKLSTLAYPN